MKMKTKLISLVWRGSAAVDPRFSAVMLPWTMRDIRNRDTFIKLSIGIENGILEAYNSDFELQFKHQLRHVIGMCKMTRKNDGRNKSFETGVVQTKGNFMEVWSSTSGIIYLLKDPKDPLLHIHLFESEAIDEMTELMQQMRDPSQTLGGSVGSIPQSIVSGNGSDHQSLQKALCGQGVQSTPASNLKFTEAMRKAQHDGGPSIFSPKMASSKSYTAGLSHSAGTVTPSQTGNLSLFSEISPSHSQFFEVMYVGKIKVSHKRVPETFIDDALPKFRAYDAQRMARLREQERRNSNSSDFSDPGSISRANSGEMLRNRSIAEESEFRERVLGTTKLQEENKENKTPRKPEFLRMQSQMVLPVVGKQDIPYQRDRSASIGTIPVVDQNRTMVFLVGKSDLRLISPDRKQVLLYKDFKDIASCAQGHNNADHFGIICREAHNDGYIAYVFKCQSEHVADDIVTAISQAFITCSEQKNKEKSQILSCEHCPMLWYHKLCNDIEGMNEKKTHNLIVKRIETLSEEEQESIMAKFYGAEEVAGHSLVQQVQFLMMLLRAHCESRQQRHVHDTAENRSEFLNHYLGGSTIFMKAKRSLSNSFDHLLKRKGSKDDVAINGKERERDIVTPTRTDDEGRLKSIISPSRPQPEQIKSPMIDIFMKVGNNPRDQHQDRAGSWRQTMLHKVATPSKAMHDSENAQLLSPFRPGNFGKKKPIKRTREDLRELWRTAIRQTILLSRMEKENACLQKRQNENEIKKIKLEYDEILPCDKQTSDLWDLYIEKEMRSARIDRRVLLEAIKSGVPRSKRGDIWMFLAEQYSLHGQNQPDLSDFPNFDMPYTTLLKNLTEHQHAIFIDLGRTFPNHKYYKQPLGVGQLSLFNLLKAYSILDPELGYCQGLGFICGILLLHLDEADAFEMLKHLMFKRQMRLKYLPDMKQFQLQLYQLSRLLKDLMPDLYDWLDQNDISPTLYAAPWILTAFSSQFPLGFVTRVFDFLFLESSDVIFRVSIALLEHHRLELLKRDNFEEIMDYLKNVFPNIDGATIDSVMTRAFSLDVQQKLVEYQVEYNVLQEEIKSQNNHLETLNRAKEENRQLETQLQIAQSSIAQLEKTRFTQQSQLQLLQTQVQSLEVTVETLGGFINQLIDTRHDLELPGEIRRIAQQIQNADLKKRMQFGDRKISKSLSMNSHLGSMLKVLEEGNENEGSPKMKNKKSPFFENTFEQIRHQKTTMRLNSFDDESISISPKKNNLTTDFEEKSCPSQAIKSPHEIDSGIATPLTPQMSPENNKKSEETKGVSKNELKSEDSLHPLSNCCDDINFQFSGTTTQLKTFKATGPKPTNGTIPRQPQEMEKNGRS